MSVESLIHTKAFEQKVPCEIERKFIPVFPERLEKFRPQSLPIEQYHLSHPTEPFNLRLRETMSHEGTLRYEATLKDAGVKSSDGLTRMEVTTEISPELYEWYRSADSPVVRKLRAQPPSRVTIDFYDDNGIQIESENEAS